MYVDLIEMCAERWNDKNILTVIQIQNLTLQFEAFNLRRLWICFLPLDQISLVFLCMIAWITVKISVGASL